MLATQIPAIDVLVRARLRAWQSVNGAATHRETTAEYGVDIRFCDIVTEQRGRSDVVQFC